MFVVDLEYLEAVSNDASIMGSGRCKDDHHCGKKHRKHKKCGHKKDNCSKRHRCD